MPEKSHIIDGVPELKEGERRLINIDGNRIILLRLDDGFYAIDEKCTHENVSLNDGTINNGEIECSKHGARFDIKSGDVRSFPAVQPLRTYRISHENNNLVIYLPVKE
jgi:3-phenylpropionate/trans-cinnamate dioxygenase ferredoxin subunit